MTERESINQILNNKIDAALQAGIEKRAAQKSKSPTSLIPSDPNSPEFEDFLVQKLLPPDTTHPTRFGNISRVMPNTLWKSESSKSESGNDH